MGVASPGPEGSLEALFLALESALLRYALRLLHDVALAEDVVQEAFLRLESQTEPVREPRSWLYRTVHNLAVSQMRAGRRLEPLPAPGEGSAAEAREPADGSMLPDEHLARWEGIGLVRLGMEGLDPRSRELLDLKFREELSYREISARTGLTEGHVGYLLHHALKALAEELSRAGLMS
ncbi:MAG: RNA polymerase sigma factor [Verrucomicrobiales bacterium]|nr:RNA polymerase sigma factor [Verrucomicrobiales bacterium]